MERVSGFRFLDGMPVALDRCADTIGQTAHDWLVPGLVRGRYVEYGDTFGFLDDAHLDLVVQGVKLVVDALFMTIQGIVSSPGSQAVFIQNTSIGSSVVCVYHSSITVSDEHRFRKLREARAPCSICCMI
mmetsp:Transcript_9450/g.9560  ORF Transcript_9450/g.9560 Transcript_9450/m.9560 type:complete len:130 (-) Transcript_9450:405-794(-)